MKKADLIRSTTARPPPAVRGASVPPATEGHEHERPPPEAPPDDEAGLRATLRRLFPGHRVVVVSHDEPVLHRRSGRGAIVALEPHGGLLEALRPLVAASGGTWVACAQGDADFEVTDAHHGVPWPAEAPRYRVRRVRLGDRVLRGYHDGFSSGALWPLCHLVYTAPTFRHEDWEMYQLASRAFARAVLEEVEGEDAVVLVNDHHLALVPRLLRKARPDLKVAHFWSVPWAHPEVMQVSPWNDALLHGLLGGDVVGFQAQHHCDNFLCTVERGIEARVDLEHRRVVHESHAAWVRPFPLGIDAAAFARAAASRPFAEAFPALARHAEGRLLLLGVDRLDPSEGVPQRLLVLEALLARRPEMRGRVVLVQVGGLSQDALPRDAALADEVRALAQQINARFGTLDWQPVHSLPAPPNRGALAALYRRADACLVTSLHDGMNLVAKEYVAAHAGEPGVLLLSKFNGAAAGLPEACLVNPHDVEGCAEALAASLALPERERADAMARLHERVLQHDVHAWAGSIFGSLHEAVLHRQAQRFPGN